MPRKGIIRIKEQGKIVEYFPQTTYDNVIDEAGSNLKTDMTALKAFKTSTENKLNTIATSATKTEASGTNGNIKINGTETAVYRHPSTTGNKHIPAGGASGQILRWSADGTAVWGADNNTTYGVATTTSNGLMSSVDKVKLDGIATGANNYVHPNDANTRHVTDTEKSTWNAKETTTGAQSKADAALVSAKAYTDTKVAGVVNSAPEALDTLKELAAALGNDPNFATTIATQIGNKVDKVTGKGLSTNDYTTAEKNKLSGIATGANNYVHPTGAGNNHIPTGGAANQYLKYSASGVAVWSALPSASTTAAGIVQLNDATNSTSTTQAATANAVKKAYDLANGKANASHGNHVPSVQTANSSVFLRNDNTWQTINPDSIGAARGGRRVATTAATAGWYRIAQSATGISNNIGKFLIKASVSGCHSITELTAAISYSVSPILNQDTHCAYSTTGISKARLVYHPTYSSNYAYLEVYVNTAAARELDVQMLGMIGWSLVAPNTSGSIPSGYTSKEITLVSQRSIMDINGTVNGFSIAKSVPSNAVFTDTVYTHPSSSGNKHIPAGGAANQYLKYSTDGTAVWSALPAASTSAAGIVQLSDATNSTSVTLGATANAVKKAYDLANGKASTSVATTSANGLMSASDKTKLDGIATGANNYTHPSSSGNKHIPAGGASGQILRWSADGTAVWGADNNTTYGVVSKSAAGLAPQLPNETTTTKYLRQDGTWVVPPNTTYGVASGSSNGLMTAADKTKLDGIATGANNYVHPTGAGNSHIPTGGAANQYLKYSASGVAVWSALPSATTSVAGIVQLNDATNSTSTTQAATANAVKKAYDLANGKASTSVATTSANGLMSAADKTKLDGIATGAQKNATITKAEIEAKLTGTVTTHTHNADNINSLKPTMKPADVVVTGRTLFNILGRVGCPDYGLTVGGYQATITTANGEYIAKVGSSYASGSITNLGGTLKTKIKLNTYHIVVAESKNVTAERTAIAVFGISGGKARYNTTKGVYETIFFAFKNGSTVPTHRYIDLQLFGTGSEARFKNIRMYEITEAEYNAIPSTDDKGVHVQNKFPYVDDMKPIINPYVECKENLLDTDIWRHGAIEEDGNTIASSTTGNVINVHKYIKAKTNDVFTFFVEGLNTSLYDVLIWNMGPNRQPTVIAQTNKATITCTHDGVIKCGIKRRDGGKTLAQIKEMEILINSTLKPTLVRGNVAKSYDECHNSLIMFETSLYSDEAIRKDSNGRYVKNSLWSEVDIDGYNILPNFAAHYSGFKGLSFSKKLAPGIDLTNLDVSEPHQIIAYNGVTYTHTADFLSSAGEPSMNFEPAFDGTTNQWYEIGFTVKNTITGWADNYTPTPEEVRAFFLGWRMFKSNSNNDFVADLYDGTGVKRWIKLWNGFGAKHSGAFSVPVVNYGGVSACPAERNTDAYTPYKLIFRKTPYEDEIVTTHGDLIVKDGIEVVHGAGLVLKQPTFVHISGGHVGHINIANTPFDVNPRQLRVDRCLKVYTADKCTSVFGYECPEFPSNFKPRWGRTGFYIDSGANIGDTVFVDYMIHRPDCVQSFDCSVTTKSTVRDILNDMNRHHSETTQRLSDSIKLLESEMKVSSNASNPNLLINADFKIWQRGVSFTPQYGGEYCADRWRLGMSTANGVGATKVDDGILIYKRINSGIYYLGYHMEELDLTKVRGKLCTVSFKANGKIYSKSAYVPMHIKEGDFFVIIRDDDYSNYTSPFYFRCDMQSGRIVIEWVKCEIGGVATAFSPKPYAEELIACQKYYQQLKPSEIVGFPSSTTTMGYMIPLHTVMRSGGTVKKGGADGNYFLKDTVSWASKIDPFTTGCAHHQISMVFKGSYTLGRGYVLILTSGLYVDAEIY